MAIDNKTSFVLTVYPIAERIRLNDSNTAHPLFVTAQAALETGWKLRNDYNLFGIKAGTTWTGKTSTLQTKEYVNGQMVSVNQKFRVYDNLEQALKDHQAILHLKGYADAWTSKDDPYQFAEKIVDNVGSKYATDPNYAKKMKQIIDEVYKIVLDNKL
ncbi:MAG: glucosaminidase domain-containing protein [Candidatus Azobacteroides sp.]|nr:glucosaminidase domain-containing protein [Candidatus Azobacteroides sp.]